MDSQLNESLAEAANVVTLDYREGNEYYLLLIKTSLLTFFTLGLYRFWQTAALRRYYWSSVAIDGDSLEYHGTGVETFIGFLLAMVLAAIYLGLFVVAGSFAGLILFENFTAIQIVAVIGFIPIFYFARYRFRRYLLSRTAWRGIRFGLAKGAWGYVWRGVAFILLTIVTLGVMEPYGRYHLEKYVNDRVRVGNQMMRLEGRWQGIYRYFIPLLLMGWISAAVAWYVWWNGVIFFALPYLLVLGLLLVTAYAYYIVRSQRYFMSHRRVGEAIELAGAFRTRSVFGRYIIGYAFAIFTALVTFYAVFLVLIVIFASAFFASSLGFDFFETLEGTFEGNDDMSMAELIPILVLFALVYLGAILAFDVTRQVFVTQPVAKYVARNVHITDTESLAKIGQGDIDDIRDADGFADALDVGFGF